MVVMLLQMRACASRIHGKDKEMRWSRSRNICIPGKLWSLTKSHQIIRIRSSYLDPWPSVIFSGGPGVDQTLPVEPRKVGVPFLQAEQSTVGGGGCYLLVGDYAALHAQWSGALWVGGGGEERERGVRNLICRIFQISTPFLVPVLVV